MTRVSATKMTLEDMYVSTVLGAKLLGLRIRPELRSGETFSLERIVASAVRDHGLDDPLRSLDGCSLRTAPEVAIATVGRCHHGPLLRVAVACSRHRQGEERNHLPHHIASFHTGSG